jgi:hypothetical protein
MVKSRLSRAVGIVVVGGVALIGRNDLVVARSQTARANRTRLASLPDNPCDLLTREQVAVATGLDVINRRRDPDIRSFVEAGCMPSVSTSSQKRQRGRVCLPQVRHRSQNTSPDSARLSTSTRRSTRS